MKKKDVEKKWTTCVAKAREIHRTLDLPQLEIAKIALEACTITWGGSKKKIAENQHTITRFANEIGVNKKTLSNWVAAYKNVYVRLDNDYRKDLSYTDIVKLARTINRDTPVDEVNRLADKYINEDSYEMKVQRYLVHLRSLCYNFEHHSAHMRCSDETLSEILFYCRTIDRRIRKSKHQIIPKIHGIASKSRTGGLSSARAVLGERVVKQ